jgi:hypothetical protein
MVGSILWLPILTHYHIATPDVGVAEIEALRRLPDDGVLREISESGLILAAGEGPAEKVRLAREVMGGKLDLPGFPAIAINRPFDAADLEKGPPTLQLHFAALIVPELLIEAYLETGEEEFFLAARDAIFAWAAYERRAWLPRGYLWNDHAVAARIPVLVKFWRIYRRHPEFTIEGARQLLQALARSGIMLARPDHFAYGTNHGVMQNIGLWQLSIAFPRLSGVGRFKQVARQRLTRQLEFYVNEEGAILEHSAGYQGLGVSLLGLSLRYATMLDIDCPGAWQERYDKAKRVYTELRRPDDTLPLYGDTLNRADSNLRAAGSANGGSAVWLAGPGDWPVPTESFLAPAAGYAVWWDGTDRWSEREGLRQTVVVWGDHPGRAHKHADELSVLLWARGWTWLSNIGYWPYGDGNRRLAVSWEGANAPHFRGESGQSARHTRLVSIAASKRLRSLELLRSTDDGFAARRQVIHVGADLWLLIDDVRDDHARDSQTIWTTFPGTAVAAGPWADSHTLSRKDSETAMLVTFLGPGAATVRTYEGSIQPFAGWIVGDEGIAPSTALVVDMPTPSHAVAVWRLVADRAAESISASPVLQGWAGPEDWEIVVPVGAEVIRVSRDGSSLLVDGPPGGDSSERIELRDPPSTEVETERIRRAYEALASEYRTWRGFYRYRRTATLVVLVLFLAQELLAAAYRRIRRRPALPLRIAAVPCWVLLGVWLHFVYFGP